MRFRKIRLSWAKSMESRNFRGPLQLFESRGERFYGLAHGSQRHSNPVPSMHGPRYWRSSPPGVRTRVAENGQNQPRAGPSCESSTIFPLSVCHAGVAGGSSDLQPASAGMWESIAAPPLKAGTAQDRLAQVRQEGNRGGGAALRAGDAGFDVPLRVSMLCVAFLAVPGHMLKLHFPEEDLFAGTEDEILSAIHAFQKSCL